MSIHFSQQILDNVKAHLDAWNAQIERYATQADEVDSYTKQAFFDELVHLQAKRDQLAESFNLSTVEVITEAEDVLNEDTETFEEWEDLEPSPEELENIDITGDTLNNEEDEAVTTQEYMSRQYLFK